MNTSLILTILSSDETKFTLSIDKFWKSESIIEFEKYEFSILTSQKLREFITVPLQFEESDSMSLRLLTKHFAAFVFRSEHLKYPSGHP